VIVRRYCLVKNHDLDTTHILIDHHNFSQVTDPISQFTYTGDNSEFMYEAVSNFGDEYRLMHDPNLSITDLSKKIVQQWANDNDVDSYELVDYV
jgi:hypothetical protein